MVIEIGFGRQPDLRPRVMRPSRFVGPDGLHPGALWIAAAAPILATLVLVARLAS